MYCFEYLAKQLSQPKQLLTEANKFFCEHIKRNRCFSFLFYFHFDFLSIYISAMIICMLTGAENQVKKKKTPMSVQFKHTHADTLHEILPNMVNLLAHCTEYANMRANSLD